MSISCRQYWKLVIRQSLFNMWIGREQCIEASWIQCIALYQGTVAGCTNIAVDAENLELGVNGSFQEDKVG